MKFQALILLLLQSSEGQKNSDTPNTFPDQSYYLTETHTNHQTTLGFKVWGCLSLRLLHYFIIWPNWLCNKIETLS